MSKEIQNQILLEKALRLATSAHQGQTDKAGAPYILHPTRVAERCSTDEEKIVAYLHDVIEDTDISAEGILLEGFSREIVDAVLSVTREKLKESYEDFIRRCALNPIGRNVKIHDLEDNMDTTRLESLDEEDIARTNKYEKAYNYLTNL